MTAPTVTRWIYDFDEGSREMRDLLGGKVTLAPFRDLPTDVMAQLRSDAAAVEAFR